MAKASALQKTTANKPEPSAEPVKEEKEAIPLSLEAQLAKVATESNADLPGNGAQNNTKPPEKLEPKPPPKFANKPLVAPKITPPDRHISTVRKIPPKPESEEPPKPQPAPEQNLDQHVVSPKTPPEKDLPKLAQTQPPHTPPLEPSVEPQTESELGPHKEILPAWQFGLDVGGRTPEILHLPIPVRRGMKFNRNLEQCQPRPELGAIPYCSFSFPDGMSPSVRRVNELARAHQESSRALADGYRMLDWGCPAWNVRSGWGN